METTPFTGTLDFDKELIRRLAYELIIDTEQTHLPILSLRAAKYDNIKIMSYNHLSYYSKRPYSLIHTVFGEYGVLYNSTVDNKYLLFLNEENDFRGCIYSISLALAYIELDFAYEDVIIDLDDSDPAIFEFVNCYLAPDNIFRECGFLDNISIIKYTALPFRNSIYKARTLKTPEVRKESLVGRFLLHSFNNFIDMLKKI